MWHQPQHEHTPEVTNVTPDFAMAEWGPDILENILVITQDTGGTFSYEGKKFRLVFDMVVDEPVIYL